MEKPYTFPTKLLKATLFLPYFLLILFSFSKCSSFDKMTFRELLTSACGVKNKRSQAGEFFITLVYMSLGSGSAKFEKTGEQMALSEKLSLILILFHNSSFPLGRKSESCTKAVFEEIIQVKFYWHKVYQSRNLTRSTMRGLFFAVKTQSWSRLNFSLSKV